jgi:hypothetical protein
MLAQFIESLTQEQTKLIQMGLMKDPKAHALTMHDGKGSSKHNGKEGYSKPYNDFVGSKDSSDSKKKKNGKKCTYCNKPNHEESTCMKKQIDLMHRHFNRTTLETSFQRESRSRRKKIMILRKVIIML